MPPYMKLTDADRRKENNASKMMNMTGNDFLKFLKEEPSTPAAPTLFETYLMVQNKGIYGDVGNTLKKSIDDEYSSRTSLPTGTRLYRSTFQTEPMNFVAGDNKLFYFGLDYIIAVWYGLEMWQKFKKDRHDISYDNWFVYLHEYEVIAPLSYKYLDDIDTNPANDKYIKTCKKTRMCSSTGNISWKLRQA